MAIGTGDIELIAAHCAVPGIHQFASKEFVFRVSHVTPRKLGERAGQGVCRYGQGALGRVGGALVGQGF